jgi:hypothetical protein
MKIEQFIWMLGFLMPLVTELLIKATWSRNIKSLVAFGISLVIGGIQVLITGQFDMTNILAAIGATFTASQLAYDQYFKSKFIERESGGV